MLEVSVARGERLNPVVVLEESTNPVLDLVSNSFFLINDSFDLLAVNALSTPSAEERQQQNKRGAWVLEID